MAGTTIHTGDKSFDKVHPNLVISFCGITKATAFTVSDYKIGKKSITYTLTRLGKKNRPPNAWSGSVSLFIDNDPISQSLMRTLSSNSN